MPLITLFLVCEKENRKLTVSKISANIFFIAIFNCCKIKGNAFSEVI